MSRTKIKKTDSSKNRKDDLDPNNDEFIQTTRSALDWAYERRRLLGLLIAVALIASVGGIVAKRMIHAASAEASQVFGEALKTSIAPIVSREAEEIPPKEESEVMTFESIEARATEALKGYEKTIAEKGDTKVGTLAIAGKADALFKLGRYDDAIKAYEEFLSKDLPSEASMPLRAMAIEGLGNAYEAAGKTDEAKAKFEELAGKESEVAARMARYHLARIAEAKGQEEEAKKLYAEVIEQSKEQGRVSKLDYVFAQARESLLAMDPEADVPPMPSGGGFDNIDPALLQQLMSQQQAGGGAS